MILTRGKCKECGDGAEKWIYSKKSNLCIYHHKLWKMKVKKPVRLKPVSDKMAKQRKQYSVLAQKFLYDNPICQVMDCQELSVQLHHKRGRGKYLLDVSTYMAVCCEHHKWIEEHPMMAKAYGYSLDRLSK